MTFEAMEEILMHKRLVAVAALWLIPAAAAVAVDNLRIKSKPAPIRGTIMKMSPYSVGIDTTGAGVTEDYPVNEIKEIIFEGEPPDMTGARRDVMDGRYEDALEALGKINPNTLTREVIKQDLAFYKAFCKAKMALAGQGGVAVTDAGNDMVQFANAPANANNYHILEANEVLGDLLVLAQKYAAAADCYQKLETAPWPDYKMKAGVLVGRALLAQGKAEEALAKFEQVLALQAPGPQGDAQRLAARLGKAACLAQSNPPKVDEAVSLIEGVLETASAEDQELHAYAYNTLGNIYKKAGNPKAAILAFLHVHLIYFSVGDAHAEALYNLAQLWSQVSPPKPEEAAKARDLLKKQYQNSPWAKKL